MGGKSPKAQPAPDYTPVAQANEKSAQIAADVAREQLGYQRETLAWAKEQYALDRQVTDRVVGQLLGTMEAESAAGLRERERYNNVFQPIEDQLIRDAESYGSPQRMEFEASRAQSDVAQAFDATRRGALANLESYGIDPSMARAGALDVAVRTNQAQVAAMAGTQSRLNTENTARALRGEAINIGRGYPGSIAQAYGTAQAAGQGAVTSGLQTTQSGLQGITGSGTFGGLSNAATGNSNSALGNWGSNIASQGQQIAASNAAAQQAAASRSAGVMSAIGTVAGAALAPFTGGASLLVAGALSGAAGGGKKGG